MEFEELEVWKRSAHVACEVYKVLSKTKDFGFRDQICRSAVSVPSNIAEGMERAGYRDQIKFLDYAKGSNAELRTQLYIGLKVGYFDREVGLFLIKETKEISAMIFGLQKRIKSKLLDRGK